MERLFELGMLLDRYEPLLTERQASILRQYADENCSLSEIAEREGISRQGVRDIIARAERQLREAEDAVDLIRKEAKQTEDGEYVIPEGIKIACETPTKFSISGIDKQLVGQTAAEIRSLRKPEPYKGKGIRYENEYVRSKSGKSGKK